MSNPDLETPARLRWRFARAVLTQLACDGMGVRDGDHPPRGHTVDRRFAGVGVATAADPAIDSYVIARLNTLGVRQVRLDFTYGDHDNHVARFLDALCAQSFHVLLHLVQPAEAARRMDGRAAAEAHAQWRDFVGTTLTRYGPHIEAVEVGSTINRQRWAGYTLRGFIAAWDIASELVRSHGVVLVGPSITDFEPIYNVGMLALLRERERLPDIHSNNLFSERCTEPERYDHKVLGQRVAPLIKYNLIKKARLLQHLGARQGVSRLWSPAAFWTQPRIQRFLPDAEQKQADYLSRYLLLCAASGALERAYWGPMICAREGLIDDGSIAYPALERITHYAGVSGAVGALRIRPSFAALAAFAALIPGCRYLGRLNKSNGLEVHAFASATELIHAVWTINARAAALTDLYDSADLTAAECRGRDGETLPVTPSIASEAPLYLLWPDSRVVRLKPGAALRPDLAIHRHAPGKAHFHYQDEHWRGMILATSPEEAAQLITALHPHKIGTPPRDSLLRKARNAVWTVADPRDANALLVIKQPINIRWYKRIADRAKPAKALRSWNGTAELLRRGIPAAEPVAYFESRDRTAITHNWFVCAHVRADATVRELFTAYAQGADSHAGIARDEAYEQLCAFLLKMHGRGVYFRDLSGGNILVRKRRDGTLGFTLIDTGRARFYNHATPLNQRIADLTRACNKLDGDGRRRFMDRYLERLGRHFNLRHRLAFGLYDFKVGLKRRLRRNALYRLLRR
jgi:hypothetical protein